MTRESSVNSTPTSAKKTKFVRSRRGCQRCKASRKKCSESRPRCLRCSKRNLACHYDEPESGGRLEDTSLTPHGASRYALDGQPRTYGSQAIEQLDEAVDRSVLTYGARLALGPGSADLDVEANVFDLERQMWFLDSAFPAVPTPGSSTAASVRQVPDILTQGSGHERFAVGQSNVLETLEHQQRLYFLHFQGEFSKTIVRKDEDPNMFFSHFARLADFKPLLHAILAVGAAHLSRLAPEPAPIQTMSDDSLHYHSKAVRGLKLVIENKMRCSQNAIIAVTICLLFYEMVQGGFSTTATHHLLGALHLMKRDTNAGLNKTSTFHHKLFRYYDVIAALSLRTRPMTGSLTFEDIPTRVREQKEPDPYGCVDNVFGLTKTLWPLLHRLAQLTKHIDPQEIHNTTLDDTIAPSASTNEALPPIFDAASPGQQQQYQLASMLDQERHRYSILAMELAIKDWKAPLELHVANMEHAASDTILQALLQNAEAYRHAALVHLYTCLFGDHPDTERVQRACKAALQACLRVVVFGSSPFGGLLWPLFVAGASAVAAADREVVLTVMDQLQRIQRMGNISSARVLLEEVWHVNDTSEGFVSWQEVARRNGQSVVLF